jgi:hypothetical protein
MMIDENIKLKLWRRICSFAPLFVLLSITLIILFHNEKPMPARQDKQQFHGACPFLIKKECKPVEQRIANHFYADTLPGLMQKGLIKKYMRSAFGTCIAVNGNLWKIRSQYFKQSLLREVFVYNKVHDYELSTKIIDSSSGKVYAQISSSSKMDIYD